MGLSLSQPSAIDTILSWDSRPDTELLFDSSRSKISEYMESIDKLQQSSHVKANSELLSKAMARLNREFRKILSRQADYHAGPTTITEYSSVADSTANALRYEDYLNCDPPNEEVITYLRNIAERMNSNGKLGEIFKIYKNVRKNFLQSQLRRIRFEEMRMNSSRRILWDELKVKIELWIQASKICVKIFFEMEKKLFQQIFHGLGPDSSRDECFVGTIKDFASGIFAFPESVVVSSQSYDKMGSVFVLYDTFVSLRPDVVSLFGCEQGNGVRNGYLETMSKIENDVERMLNELEKNVLNEISMSLDDGGGIHQMTDFVMDQISSIVRYKNFLKDSIKKAPSLSFDGSFVAREDLRDQNTHNFLDLHVILILEALQKNLEKKFKSYKDPSLGHLFMMNNVRQIVQKVDQSPELKEMIGDSYLNKLHSNISSSKSSYQTRICERFLKCFRDEGLYTSRCFRPRLSKTTLRKRIKSFNEVFEEIQSIHSPWSIPDPRLRDEVRSSMSNELVPAYRSFLEKCRSVPEINFHGTSSMKYSAEDLEALVLKKFFANGEIA